MSTEIASRLRSGRSLRVDTSESENGCAPTWKAMIPVALVAAMALGFVAIGGGGFQPSHDEARLGLAAGEGVGPFAQVMGGWEPSIAPGRVLVAQAWAWMDGGTAMVGAIRWPMALAAIALALLVFRLATSCLGTRAGVFAALGLLGSYAMIDRSATTGADFLAGLAVIGTLARIFSRGSGWAAGLWAAASVMLGGWPALAVILLPIVALGRPGASLSPRLLAPPILTFAGWSAWALTAAKPEVWASALMLPLMQPPAWTLGLSALTVALPWSPLAALVAWPSVRSALEVPGRSLIVRWMQVAGISLLAGTLIPGLSTAALTPILVALALAEGAVLDRAWGDSLSNGPRRTMLGLGLAIGLAGAVLLAGGGAFLAIAQPYYRGVGIILIVLGLGAGLLAIDSAWMGSARGAVRVVILVAVGLKVGHAWHYVPEMDYRFGQGPWGRAIAQHVPPRWPIYVFHPWSPALALATEHPMRVLPAEIFLKEQPGGVKFMLLQAEEFAHWPEIAPTIQKVREFQDERGAVRVLARTQGRLIRHIRDDD